MYSTAQFLLPPTSRQQGAGHWSHVGGVWGRGRDKDTGRGEGDMEEKFIQRASISIKDTHGGHQAGPPWILVLC